jgi:hypothetical protein
LASSLSKSWSNSSISFNSAEFIGRKLCMQLSGRDTHQSSLFKRGEDTYWLNR